MGIPFKTLPEERKTTVTMELQHINVEDLNNISMAFLDTYLFNEDNEPQVTSTSATGLPQQVRGRLQNIQRRD